MKQFQVHTVESAPQKSKQALQILNQKFGFIPNVAATMAESPVLASAFIGGFGSFHGSGFDETEKQVLLLTNAVTIKSPWTVAFHTTMALQEGVAEEDVRAIRSGQPPRDPKYAALSKMAKALIERRGNIGASEIDVFVAAGYSQDRVLDVVAGIGISTMAALTGNMAHTPLEEAFKANAWAAN